MADRETILAALFTAIQATVEDVGENIYFERNRNSPIEEAKFPAVLMWDGDESSPDGFTPSIGRNPLIKMEMTPEIWGFVRDDKADIGTALNSLLRRVQRAIYTTDTFQNAVGDLTKVRISSVSTSLGKGKKATGDFGLQLTIEYQFHPAS